MKFHKRENNPWMEIEAKKLREELREQKQDGNCWKIFLFVMFFLLYGYSSVWSDEPYKLKTWYKTWECKNCGYDNYDCIRYCGKCGTDRYSSKGVE